MGKQLVIYEKESGVISQIMSFNQDVDFTVESLGLDKKYDLSRVGFLFEELNKFINIKKDRVFDNRITRIAQPVFSPQQSTSEGSLFEEVSYKKLPEHVGLITPWNQECGIANYSKDLVDNLKCQVTVFCEKSNNPEYHDPKVKVIPCWTNRDNSYLYLVEILKKNKVDVVHVQYNHDLMNSGQLKIFGRELREAGIRGIITLHSTKGGVDIFGKSFDTLITHSKSSVNDLLGENVTKNQVRIIQIGTSSVPQTKSKKIACIEKNLDYNRPIISNFGFLLPQKGIKEQLRALRIIKNQVPNILLLIVCAIHKTNKELSTKYYNECKSLVENLDLVDNVIFETGYLSYNEIYDYLHCSDIIVLPYVNSAAQATSSAGRTVLAALRPVIATNVEIFDDLEDIVIKIEPRNEGLLVESILKLLYDKESQSVILNNIKSFIESTSWKNIAKEHCKIYKSLGDIKIDIEGQIFSYFSASVVNRNLGCALSELGVDVVLRSVNLAENLDYELGDNSRELSEKRPNNLIHVRHQFPPNFNEFEGRTKILYLQVETSVLDEWINSIEESDIDFIWVYTNHAKELLRKAGITKTVDVIKCGFDRELFNENVIPIDLSNVKDSYTKQTVNINDDTFVFLFVGHAQERKNFKSIFKSYLTEFDRDENVLFVIKSYDGGEVHKTVLELIEYVSEVLEKSEKCLPKHLYIYEDTDPNILPQYYKAANVMVQCSRAEGFGKPIVEAMGMGIPSISVLWSGPKDFCTEKNSFPVPFKLVKSTYHVQSKDNLSFWAETKIEDLRKVMRFCFENPEEIKKRGRQALLDSRCWTTEESAFDVIDFVRKYNL